MRKRISELAELKVKNCNLTLQLLQVQAERILLEKEKIILEEMRALELSPDEWKFNENTWELYDKAEQ